ncbi:MAG: HEPN domain-containing protein [Candidatus Rokuibacteriota bacterium]
MDLDHARLAAREGHLEWAVFAAQQAAERPARPCTCHWAARLWAMRSPHCLTRSLRSSARPWSWWTRRRRSTSFGWMWGELGLERPGP